MAEFVAKIDLLGIQEIWTSNDLIPKMQKVHT